MADWAWMREYDEFAHGPFKTKDEALANAREALQGYSPKKIHIGEVEYATPATHVWDDVDRHLEEMDQSAGDNGFAWCDDEIFVVKDKVKAQEALTKLMEQWAEEYVTSDKWSLIDSQEVDLDSQQ